jgi:hypothetical protein
MGTLAGHAYDVVGGTDPSVRDQSAATVELFVAASYVLDRVMDEEVPSDSTVGLETAYGTGLVLLSCALQDAPATPGAETKLSQRAGAPTGPSAPII